MFKKSLQSKSTILLVANTDWYIYNFRLDFAKELLKRGYQICVICPKGSYVPALQSIGIQWIEWELNRKSKNPFSELLSIYKLSKIYSALDPTIIHHFTIKAVLYGTLAARLQNKSQVFNSITGLGHLFLDQKISTKIIRKFVSFAIKNIIHLKKFPIIFQNKEDHQIYKNLGYCSNEKSRLVRGSGIDLKRFAKTPFSSKENTRDSFNVLFSGRLLKEKGILDFIVACKILNKQNLNIKFFIAGIPDPGNPSSISLDHFNKLKANKQIQFLGHIDDMPSLIAQSDVIVLPSHREGLPKIILEAQAMGKPVIVSDVAGCREIVSNHVTGILVPPKAPKAIAHAILLIKNNPELAKTLGDNGYKNVSKHFSQDLIISQTLKVYAEFGIEIVDKPDIIKKAA